VVTNELIGEEAGQNQDDRLLCQKITRFEGVLITQAYFTNSSIYGRLLITVSTSAKKPGAKPRLMLHRIRDLIQVNSTDENGLPYKVKVNCPKLGVHVPKDFIAS